MAEQTVHMLEGLRYQAADGTGGLFYTHCGLKAADPRQHRLTTDEDAVTCERCQAVITGRVGIKGV